MSRHGLLVTSGMGAVLAAGLSAAVWATETKTYTYDALGRLVIVQSAGTVNNGDANSLCYDPAGNRTTYKSSGSEAIAACVPAPSPTPSPTPTPTPTPTPANSPPVANPNSVTVMCTNITSVNVTANDTDPEGNYPLTVTNVTVNSGGAEAYVESASTIQVWGGILVGTSSATYTVKDSLNASSTGTLTITTTGNQSVCSSALMAAPQPDAVDASDGASDTPETSGADPPGNE